MDEPNENLLLRWSRRKAQARQDKVPEPVPQPSAEEALAQQPVAAAPEPVAQQQPADAETDEAVRVEDLPDIETLTYESDFSVFMRKGVPEFIRQQALRKLWVSNPILANLDGLNGYEPMNMKAIHDLEGAMEPIAEVGRSLRDKIMEEKRVRSDNLHGPRAGPGGRRQRRHNAEVTRPEVKAEPVADKVETAKSRPDDI